MWGRVGWEGREFQLKSFFTSHMEGPVIKFKSK